MERLRAGRPPAVDYLFRYRQTPPLPKHRRVFVDRFFDRRVSACRARPSVCIRLQRLHGERANVGSTLAVSFRVRSVQSARKMKMYIVTAIRRRSGCNGFSTKVRQVRCRVEM